MESRLCVVQCLVFQFAFFFSFPFKIYVIPYALLCDISPSEIVNLFE
jgi:hypothetical protein